MNVHNSQLWYEGNSLQYRDREGLFNYRKYLIKGKNKVLLFTDNNVTMVNIKVPLIYRYCYNGEYKGSSYSTYRYCYNGEYKGSSYLQTIMLQWWI